MSAPYVSPILSLELPDSTLSEAIEALAQTIGYEWSYPQQVKQKKVSIKQVGTVDELLIEIGRQASVGISLNHKRRVIRVIDTKELAEDSSRTPSPYLKRNLKRNLKRRLEE